VALILDANKPDSVNGVKLSDYERMLERRQELIESGAKVI
jgi:hypothetical protein